MAKTKVITNEQHFQALVKERVDQGELLPANRRPCLECGAIAQKYRHHCGYDYPGDISPACTACYKRTLPANAKEPYCAVPEP